ncbi:MAG: segregation/condensation protein A [Acinetobacter populi]|jgi:segregation and condensation protein A|uniref:segregation and condensation protein A n=1 Tax=Acinetobacter populi TaxID=1582270 RepID=UPI00235301E2|nr:segregation/condensation protein A [Acinetobacter populi]MCH4248344.1 segregation/condensation protein A [Acinetobacter populi]
MSTELYPNIEEQLSIRVLDEYYQDIPEDLYIPPEAFAILLEQFEGPLDFLLYLVQKNGFDLKHLDIAPIAQQYISYMDRMKSDNIELTADYMVMAALLADLKSRLLLPKPESAPNFEDDPKKQLIDRLEQYLRIKQAAERLSQLNILERDVFDAKVSLGERGIVYEGYDAQSLSDALLCVFQRPEPYIHNIEQEPVLLEERIQYICERVAEGGVLTFDELLKPAQGRMGMVVTFMAILELVKQQFVHIVEDGHIRPLSIQGKHYAQSNFS